MKPLLFLIANLVLCSSALAQIDYQSNVNPGDLIVLRSQVDATAYTWVQIAGPKKAVYVPQDGRTLITAHGKRDLLIFLLVATRVGEDGGLSVDQYTAAINVGDVEPPQPDDPIDPPPPDPIPPDDRTDVEKFVRDKLSLVVQAGTFEQERDILVGCYLTVLTKIDSGELKTPSEIVNHTKHTITGAFTEGMQDRWYNFFLALADELLNPMSENGELDNADKYRTVFQQIVKGLKQ